MALATLASEILYPGFGQTNNSVMSVASGSTLDAAGEYDCFIFRAREAMTISHVYLKPNAVSGSPTADIRIETVDATTGLPSGTLWATNTNIVTGTLTTSGDVHALTASATIARGDYVAVKIAYNSGTSFAITRISFSRVAQSSLPYTVGNTGTPAKASLGVSSLAIGLGSSSSSFYFVQGLAPVSAVAGSGNISTSTYDAYGVRFRLPFKARCNGFVHLVQSATYGPFTYGIYDDSGSELSSSSTPAMDPDMMGNQAGGVNLSLPLDNSVELSANTWYRFMLWPTTTTAFVMYTYTAATAGTKAAMPGGADWHLATKAAGGAWDVSVTDTQPVLNLLLDQLDAGGGSGSFSVSMSG